MEDLLQQIDRRIEHCKFQTNILSKQKKLFSIYGGAKKASTLDGASLRQTVESAHVSLAGSVAAGGRAGAESTELDDGEHEVRLTRGDEIADDGPTSPPEVASSGADEIGIAARVELAQSMGYQKSQLRTLLLKQAELVSAEKHLDLVILRQQGHH